MIVSVANDNAAIYFLSSSSSPLLLFVQKVLTQGLSFVDCGIYNKTKLMAFDVFIIIFISDQSNYNIKRPIVDPNMFETGDK